ncbi:MAG: leucyl aminopeptidase family protein [Alphaproteobacteria bacterium]|nr:leucyl aminopeptidase family protein [Alphaproteobacteria bacterium]
MASAVITSAPRARALTLVPVTDAKKWLRRQPATTRNWLESAGFAGKAGDLQLLPSASGRGSVGAVMVFAHDGTTDDFWRLAGLAMRLPVGAWRVEGEIDGTLATRLAIAWGLGAYQFTRYRKAGRAPAKLVIPASADRTAAMRTVEANALVRDLVNTPSQDMGPAELAAAAIDMAKALGMSSKVIVGEALLSEGYRLVHAVGRASSRPPRLIDLRWGDEGHPKVTLVGKGVCFDTGGLDLKNADGMKMMKKDMGGAAHVLGLAHMIVKAKLRVRLRVLIPAVENSVSGDAFRPLDVITSRKGLTVEIGNTDAEGRLILADALNEASSEKPALVIDMATLTGAARIALGPDLPATYCNDDAIAESLARHARAEADPLWRMPLWRPYRPLLDSRVADLNNISGGPMAGSITAALFMQEFVEPGVPWVHLDIFAWNAIGRPGRPEGAEAQALRALHALVAERIALAAP